MISVAIDVETSNHDDIVWKKLKISNEYGDVNIKDCLQDLSHINVDFSIPGNVNAKPGISYYQTDPAELSKKVIDGFINQGDIVYHLDYKCVGGDGRVAILFKDGHIAAVIEKHGDRCPASFDVSFDIDGRELDNVAVKSKSGTLLKLNPIVVDSHGNRHSKTLPKDYNLKAMLMGKNVYMENKKLRESEESDHLRFWGQAYCKEPTMTIEDVMGIDRVSYLDVRGKEVSKVSEYYGFGKMLNFNHSREGTNGLLTVTVEVSLDNTIHDIYIGLDKETATEEAEASIREREEEDNKVQVLFDNFYEELPDGVQEWLTVNHLFNVYYKNRREVLHVTYANAWARAKQVHGDCLMCEYEGNLYRVCGSSKMGDIWLCEDHNNAEFGNYDLRVSWKQCDNWFFKK